MPIQTCMAGDYLHVFQFCMCIVSYQYNESLNVCLKKKC